MLDVNSGLVQNLIEDVVASLEKKVSKSDSAFDIDLLRNDVEGAVREIYDIRRYPKNYTDDMIADDLGRYYSKIYNLALLDYATNGMSFQKSHSESGVNMTMTDRQTILSGVLPLSRF